MALSLQGLMEKPMPFHTAAGRLVLIGAPPPLPFDQHKSGWHKDTGLSQKTGLRDSYSSEALGKAEIGKPGVISK